jgi:hypothetical protein
MARSNDLTLEHAWRQRLRRQTSSGMSIRATNLKNGVMRVLGTPYSIMHGTRFPASSRGTILTYVRHASSMDTILKYMHGVRCGVPGTQWYGVPGALSEDEPKLRADRGRCRLGRG